MRSSINSLIAVLALVLSVVAFGWAYAVHGQQAPIASFTQEYHKIAYGSTVKVHWLSYHAATCQLSWLKPNGQAYVSRSVPLNGQYTVGHVTHLTVLRIECDNKPTVESDGQSEGLYDKDISVIDVAPPISLQ